MNLNRRSFLKSGSLLVLAPAIVKAESLMVCKPSITFCMPQEIKLESLVRPVIWNEGFYRYHCGYDMSTRGQALVLDCLVKINGETRHFEVTSSFTEKERKDLQSLIIDPMKYCMDNHIKNVVRKS
jgi:hypothetical protein